MPLAGRRHLRDQLRGGCRHAGPAPTKDVAPTPAAAAGRRLAVSRTSSAPGLGRQRTAQAEPKGPTHVAARRGHGPHPLHLRCAPPLCPPAPPRRSPVERTPALPAQVSLWAAPARGQLCLWRMPPLRPPARSEASASTAAAAAARAAPREPAEVASGPRPLRSSQTRSRISPTRWRSPEPGWGGGVVGGWRLAAGEGERVGRRGALMPAAALACGRRSNW